MVIPPGRSTAGFGETRSLRPVSNVPLNQSDHRPAYAAARPTIAMCSQPRFEPPALSNQSSTTTAIEATPAQVAVLRLASPQNLPGLSAITYLLLFAAGAQNPIALRPFWFGWAAPSYITRPALSTTRTGGRPLRRTETHLFVLGGFRCHPDAPGAVCAPWGP